MCVQKSFFGKPENFGGGQLPTYRQVGRQFLQTKKDLQAQNLGTKILGHDVAKQVKQILKSKKMYLFDTLSVHPSGCLCDDISKRIFNKAARQPSDASSFIFYSFIQLFILVLLFLLFFIFGKKKMDGQKD